MTECEKHYCKDDGLYCMLQDVYAKELGKLIRLKFNIIYYDVSENFCVLLKGTFLQMELFE